MKIRSDTKQNIKTYHHPTFEHSDPHPAPHGTHGLPGRPSACDWIVALHGGQGVTRRRQATLHERGWGALGKAKCVISCS